MNYCYSCRVLKFEQLSKALSLPYIAAKRLLASTTVLKSYI